MYVCADGYANVRVRADGCAGDGGTRSEIGAKSPAQTGIKPKKAEMTI